MDSILVAVLIISAISASTCLEQHEYGIMFDAGSTGSRIHVFTFSRDKDGSLTLNHELYKHVSPGLSSYANDPKKGADSLRSMLEDAKAVIPKDRWASTPIALKATAGLRLLPKAKSEGLLKAVFHLFKSYPFKVEPDTVDIMDGTHEGIYAWMTINFLLKGKLNNAKNTVGTLDLGGASTQIAFDPSRVSTIRHAPKGYAVPVKLKDGSIKLYVHSYLGLGLEAAHLQILGRKLGNRDNSSPLYSPCMPTGYDANWTYQGVVFRVKAKGKTDFKKCMKAVERVITEYHIGAPKELKNKKMYAFSAFYWVALDAGIVGKNGGILTWADYLHSAKKVCRTIKKDAKWPFVCMDLIYAALLFRDGYHLSRHNKIHVLNSVHDVDAGWTLGATFSMIGV